MLSYQQMNEIMKEEVASMRFFRWMYCRTFQIVLRIALPFLPYRVPRIVDSCQDLDNVLLSEKIGSVLIVTDEGVRRNGLTWPVEMVLRKCHIAYGVYDRTRPNPTVDNVEEALAMYKKLGCEGIIAVGGGSSMDCAKVLGARVAYPNKTIGQMKGILRVLRRLPVLVAVPTTAGTGSEVTLGEWTAAEGLVYDFFDEKAMPDVPEGEFARWRISCDYGTRNPASFGLWGEMDGIWYRTGEFYYDARECGRQKTDGEYVQDVRDLAGGRCIETVIVDPSAASFIEALRREGWSVRRADNRVLEGIRRTAQALKGGKIVICRGCRAAAREFGLYRWEEAGEDRVRKEFDHAMDDIRYFVMALEGGGGSAAAYVERDVF